MNFKISEPKYEIYQCEKGWGGACVYAISCGNNLIIEFNTDDQKSELDALNELKLQTKKSLLNLQETIEKKLKEFE